MAWLSSSLMSNKGENPMGKEKKKLKITENTEIVLPDSKFKSMNRQHFGLAVSL